MREVAVGSERCKSSAPSCSTRRRPISVMLSPRARRCTRTLHRIVAQEELARGPYRRRPASDAPGMRGPATHRLAALGCGGSKKIRQQILSVGVGGYRRATFRELIRHLQRALPASRYRRRITLGTSGGGSAAIMAALLMGADRGLSICGSESKTRAGNWLRWRLRMGRMQGRRIWTRALVRLRFGFCAGCRSQPGRCESFTVAKLHPIPGADMHNVFSWLLDRGQLAGCLEALIE